MKKVNFIFAIHNHQPVGNFDHVAEEAYQKSYLPLMEALRDHPWFRFCIHHTGSLFEWLERAHPEYLKMLAEMAASGQVEIMGGGFYEPILALLPDEDKTGQIRKLAGYIKERFGQDPKGIWLAERVWEPHLAHDITAAGVEYVVVDDFHFKMAGFRDNELTGYFLTEEHGTILRVFPGSERLRYTLPFKQPEETIEYLRRLPDAGEHTLSVMADDGEKFGVWPGTFKWVYEEGWMRRFLKALHDNRDWIETTTFGDYIKAEGPRGRAYLPTASYMEMGEWSLPPQAMMEYEDFLEDLKRQPGFDTRRLFVKGGFFRNFLAKYPESNAIHKRMLQVSRKVQRAMAAAGGKSGEKKEQVAAMLDDLWRGQCNDAFWHGVFGGLYLPHLRDALYRHLIKADEAADRLIHGGEKAGVTAEEGDFDGDLAKEVALANGKCVLLADPAEGGIIYELDYRPASMNFMNTLARRQEAYHRKIAGAAHGGGGEGAATIHERMAVKEQGLEELLSYDWYRRASLIDHFMGSEMDFDAFRRSSYNEVGDFVKGVYAARTEVADGEARLKLSRSGRVLDQPVRVEKTVTMVEGEAGFQADYTLVNEDGEELNTVFGPEFNFSLLAGNSTDRYFEVEGHVLKARNFASAGELNNVKDVTMVDEWLGYRMRLSWSENAVLWRFPIETVSQSEAGYERVYQGSVLLPLWRVTLPPGGRWGVGIRLAIEGTK